MLNNLIMKLDTNVKYKCLQMCGNVNTVLARQYIIKSDILQDCYRDA